VCPNEQLTLLAEIGREVDKVFDAALSKHWTGREFRSSRQQLGLLGAQLLSAVRTETLGKDARTVETLWAWERAA